MVGGEAGYTPWEGRHRLDRGAAPPVPFELIGSEDRLTFKSAEVVVEVGLAPPALRWCRPEGALFAADRPSRAYGFGRHHPNLLHAMARHPKDRYYGLGDKTGTLDLKGRRLRTVMTDALGRPAISQFWDGEGAHLTSPVNPASPRGRRGWRGHSRDRHRCHLNDNNEYELWNEDARCAGFGQPLPLDLVRPAQPLG